MGEDEQPERPLWQVGLYFFSMVGILVFANWGRPLEPTGLWFAIFRAKWVLTVLFALLFAVCLWRFFKVKAGWIILAALPAIILAVVLPAYPVASFAAGAAGLAALLSTLKGSGSPSTPKGRASAPEHA